MTRRKKHITTTTHVPWATTIGRVDISPLKKGDTDKAATRGKVKASPFRERQGEEASDGSRPAICCSRIEVDSQSTAEGESGRWDGTCYAVRGSTRDACRTDDDDGSLMRAVCFRSDNSSHCT